MRCVKCLVTASCLVTLSPFWGKSLLFVACRLSRMASQCHEPTVQHRHGQTKG